MSGFQHLSPSSDRIPNRAFRLGAKLAGAVVAAGLAYAVAAPSPAVAAPGDWRAGCQFKSIPGGAADGIRYDACMHQRDCQTLANAAHQRIFESGCFWVSPEQEQPSTQRPAPPPPSGR